MLCISLWVRVMASFERCSGFMLLIMMHLLGDMALLKSLRVVFYMLTQIPLLGFSSQPGGAVKPRSGLKARSLPPNTLWLNIPPCALRSLVKQPRQHTKELTLRKFTLLFTLLTMLRSAPQCLLLARCPDPIRKPPPRWHLLLVPLPPACSSPAAPLAFLLAKLMVFTPPRRVLQSCSMWCTRLIAMFSRISCLTTLRRAVFPLRLRCMNSTTRLLATVRVR